LFILIVLILVLLLLLLLFLLLQQFFGDFQIMLRVLVIRIFF